MQTKAFGSCGCVNGCVCALFVFMIVYRGFVTVIEALAGSAALLGDTIVGQNGSSLGLIRPKTDARARGATKAPMLTGSA